MQLKFFHWIVTGDGKQIYFNNTKYRKSWVDPSETSTPTTSSVGDKDSKRSFEGKGDIPDFDCDLPCVKNNPCDFP